MNCIYLCNCISSLNLFDIVPNLPCCLWICIAVIIILILVFLITVVIVVGRCHKRAYKESLIEMCMWKSKTHVDFDDMLKMISENNKL